MGQGGRVYTDRITLNPPPDAPGDGQVNFYAVEGDPNGVLDADLGDRAWQISSTNKWVCTGGTAWTLDDGGGGGGPLRQFTWDPTAVTDADQGVYDTFAGAQAAAEAAVVDASGALITLYVVGEDVTVEDAGAYDMTGIALVGQSTLANNRVTLRVPDGVTFTNPGQISNLTLNYEGSGTLITFATGLTGGVFHWGPNASFAPFGGGVAGTVFAITGAGSVDLHLHDNSTLRGGDAGGVAVDVQDTATLTVYAYSLSAIEGDVISGAAGATLYILREGSSVVDDQTGFLGTYAGPAAGALPYQTVTPTSWDFSQAGGGAPVTVNSAIDAILTGRTLFGAPYDPQLVVSAGQGAVQPEMGATPAASTLVSSGLMATATVVSPAAVSIGTTPAFTYGLRTNAAAGSDAYVHYAGDADGYSLEESGTRLSAMFQVSGWTDIRCFIGFVRLTTTALAADDPAADHIALQFSTARGDTTFQIATRTAGVQTLTNTTVVPSNGAYYQFEIAYTGLARSTYVILRSLQTGAILYSADMDALGISVPALGTYFAGVRALAASQRTFGISRLSMQQKFGLLSPVA